MRRIEEKAKRLGTSKSRAINKALEFLLLMGFFDYANPYEWIEAKVEEICGEEEVAIEEEERREEREKEPKEEPKEEVEERIGIDTPLWDMEPKEEKREEPPKEEEEDEEWTITF